MTSSLAFRNDIHALRALAVVVVVLFHFDVAGFTGGFSGVDVFFVISGFLMTGIILSGSEKGNFSIWRFYWARVRRIMPALTVLCACLLAFGWFWVGPSEYERLALHALSSLGFSSNFVYKGEAGYFDIPSQQKWLLHTWALSVEWQFYMLYPLLLALVAKIAGDATRAIGWTLVVLTAVSLAGSIVLSPIKPNFSFFILPTRIWEMVAGGLVYLHITRRGKPLPSRYALAGLCLFALSTVWFHHGMVWPGYAALAPVAGAVLFIAAAPQHRLVRHPILQRIGDWSYSIYLWHWPVYVALAYFNLRFTGWQVTGIALSLLLGALSYYTVEQPARALSATKRNVALLLLPVAILAALCCLAIRHQGYPDRVDEHILLADREAHNGLPSGLLLCGQGADASQPERLLCVAAHDGRTPGAILWGDSHAGAIVGALQEHLQQPVAVFSNQCPVIFHARLKGKTQKANCRSAQTELRTYLDNAPPETPLIIAARFSSQVHGPNESPSSVYGLVYEDATAEEQALHPHALFHKKLVETLCTVASTRKTYVVRPIPEIGIDVPRTVVRQLMTGRKPDVALSLASYRARHAVVMAALEQAESECGVILLDTPAYLCADGEWCAAVKDGRPLYIDDDHLSEFGNRLLIPMFADAEL